MLARVLALLVEVVVKSMPVRIALLVLEILGALTFLAIVATLCEYRVQSAGRCCGCGICPPSTTGSRWPA